jgi:hypothetical protein
MALRTKCLSAEQWEQAEKIIRQALMEEPGQALMEEPDCHWWLIHLYLVLIEQAKYAEAQEALR